MKKIHSILRFAIAINALILINACSSNAQNAVAPTAFEAKIVQPNVQLVDVRTPQEFANGHLENARNINYNDPKFKENTILALTRDTPSV